MPTWFHLMCMAVVVLGSFLLAACEMETRVVKEAWWNDLPADAAPAEDSRRGAAAHGTWTIPLDRFTGNDRQGEAQSLVRQLRASELWVEDVDGVATVYRGRYHDPSSDEARIALQKTRRIELDGERPFNDARLTHLSSDGRGRASDPHDLRQYVGYYTLQIGYYDADFGKDFRDAAEEAVEALRADEHEAYYYHGPHRSLVAVGLFQYPEAFITAANPTGSKRSTVDAYSPRVRELQKAFPHNLGNGRTLIDYNKEGERLGERASFLVRVF